MLIAFIVTAVVMVVLCVLINVCYKKAVKPNYDFSTEPPKNYVMGAYGCLVISLLTIVGVIIACFFSDDQTSLWAVFGVAVFLGIIALILLYGLHFTYEAIDGDKVYIRGFFTLKQFDVSDVKRIKRGVLVFLLYDKNDRRLFQVDLIKQGAYKFIGIINDKIMDGVNADDEKAAIAASEEILTDIGREYRASYNKRRKKFILRFTTISVAIVIGLTLILWAVGANTAWIVMMSVIEVIGFIMAFSLILFGMKNELRVDDLTLGTQHKHMNKKIKGASKIVFNGACALCVTIMIFGAVLSLFPLLLSLLSNKPNYDELTRITGTVEYSRKQYGKNSYIAIGLNDISTEYRLYSIYLDEFDYSFFGDVTVGNTVTILVDNDEAREFSISGVSKKQWNDFYYLATEHKEYFTYEDYVKGVEKNDMAGFSIATVGVVSFVAATVALIISGVVYKKRKKEETIEIYIKPYMK